MARKAPGSGSATRCASAVAPIPGCATTARCSTDLVDRRIDSDYEARVYAGVAETVAHPANGLADVVLREVRLHPNPDGVGQAEVEVLADWIAPDGSVGEIGLRQTLAEPRPVASTLYTATPVGLHAINTVTGAAGRVGTAQNYGLDAAIEPTSLAWDGRLLWMAARSPGRLYKVDRADGTAERIPGPDNFGVGESLPTAMTWASYRLLMLGDDLDALLAVDRTWGRAVRVHDIDRFGVGENQPDGLAWDGWRLWMVGGINDALHRIDGRVGRAVRTGMAHRFGQDLGGGGELAWDGSSPPDAAERGYALRARPQERGGHAGRCGRGAGRPGRRPGVGAGGTQMTAGIDLSRLTRPEVEGLQLSVDEVHVEILAWLAAQYDWTLTVDGSDPAWRLSRLWAAREAMIRQAIADSLAQASLAYADDENLDHIGTTYYLLPRLEAEGDDTYRQRLASAVERYAVGLSGPWYESVARGVTGVADARVTSPAPGDITIYILANEALVDAQGDPVYADGIPSAALLEAVKGVVTADENRQQTDAVTVSACTRVKYDVTVTLTPRAEPDSATVLADARQGLAGLSRDVDVLGGALTPELIAGAAVDPAQVLSAAITIETGDPAAEVDSIASMDSVAPKARTISVVSS